MLKGDLVEDEKDFGPVYGVSLRTKWLHMSMTGLYRVPEHVYTLTSLHRLDLSQNDISELSGSVGNLVALEDLWISENPITKLPVELSRCRELRCLDARSTELGSVPAELGRLRHLFEIDVTETPYARELTEYKGPGDTWKLTRALKDLDDRATLKKDIFERACAGIYHEIAETRADDILALIDAVNMDMAWDELKNVARNCDRLFPKTLPGVDVKRAARKIKDKLLALRKENEKKKLAVELELKMRAFYYDKINPAKVEGYVAAVYEGGTKDDRPFDLEDIQFLIKYAAKLLPPEPDDIRGPAIRRSVFGLQRKLDHDRANCVRDLTDALAHLYADVEPPRIHHLAATVADHFKSDRFATPRELEDLKKLAADATLVFPPEFNNANPKKIRIAFKQRELNTAIANDGGGGP